MYIVTLRERRINDRYFNISMDDVNKNVYIDEPEWSSDEEYDKKHGV